MIRYLVPFLNKHKIKMCVYALLGVILALLGIIEPYFQSNFLDEIVYGTEPEKFYLNVSIVIILNIFTLFISCFSQLYTAKVRTRISFEMISHTIEHVQKIPLLKVKKFDPAYLTSRISSDTNAVLSFFLNNFTNIIISPVTIIVSLGILIKINPVLALISIACIPAYLIIYIALKHPLARTRKIYIENQNEFTGKLTEGLSLIEEIKTEGIYSKYLVQIAAFFEKVFSSYIKALNVDVAFSSIHAVVGLIFQFSNLIYGGLLVSKGILSIGEYTLINIYFFYVLKQVNYFFNLGKEYQNANVSFIRLKELLGYHIEKNGDKKIENIHKLSASGIAFSYEYEGNNIIGNFTRDFIPGKLFCIIGDNGSGKTTLLNILIYLIQDVNSGEIKINDKDVANVDFYDARLNLISVVKQNPKFPKENVFNLLQQHSNTNVSLEKINSIIEIWNLHELYYNEQFNLMNVMGKSMLELSGGEQQKMALLFALIKTPNVLILDEPTSAMDKRSSDIVIDFLHQYKREHITVCISHDQRIIYACDELIELPS